MLVSSLCDWLVWIQMGKASSAMHCGLMWLLGISTVFQRPLTVSFHSFNGRQMPAVKAVQGDCETVHVIPADRSVDSLSGFWNQDQKSSPTANKWLYQHPLTQSSKTTNSISAETQGLHPTAETPQLPGHTNNTGICDFCQLSEVQCLCSRYYSLVAKQLCD